MSLLTSQIFNRISFQVIDLPGKRHTVTFYAGYAVQHHFERQIADTGIWTEIDMSDYSPFIGLTYKAFKRKAPTAKCDQSAAPADFALREFRGVDTWLAGRWNFLKAYTADNHVSSRLLNTIREVIHHAE